MIGRECKNSSALSSATRLAYPDVAFDLKIKTTPGVSVVFTYFKKQKATSLVVAW